MTVFADTLFAAMAAHGDAPAIERQGATLTHGDLLRRSETRALELKGEGVGAFRPCPVLVDNSPVDLIELLAVYRADGVAVPIHRATPRARIEDEEGKVTEWRSKALPRYQRLTKKAEALIASVYLAGTNTRRVKRALYGLFQGAVGKDVVSRAWRKVKVDWDAWSARSLGEEDIVRLILDGTVIKTRLDRKARRTCPPPDVCRRATCRSRRATGSSPDRRADHGSRRSPRRAHHAPDPAAPSVPGCSCRTACR